MNNIEKCIVPCFLLCALKQINSKYGSIFVINKYLNCSFLFVKDLGLNEMPASP